TQPEHFLASARGVSRAKVLVHNIKEFLKLVGGATREHRHQFLGNQIGNSTGKCVFLENSHRAEIVAQFSQTNSTILAPRAMSDCAWYTGPKWPTYCPVCSLNFADDGSGPTLMPAAPGQCPASRARSIP